MPRLLVTVEGQTEETFVNDVLRRHLQAFGFESVNARLMGNARMRSRRGGVRKWPEVLADLKGHLAEDRNLVVGLMVDYDGMPSSGDGGWPGRQDASTLPFAERGRTVEGAIAEAVQHSMVWPFNPKRFLPCVVMHEFEGLLFSDCALFAQAIGRPRFAANLQGIRDQFRTPEEINDSPKTAPSKRVQVIMPDFGSLAAKQIGLNAISQECENFRRWLRSLEELGTSVEG